MSILHTTALRCGPLRMPFVRRDVTGIHRSFGDGSRRAKIRRSNAKASEHRLALDHSRRRSQRAGKDFDNHYGFRVANHQEVEAAWKYIEAHKAKYNLSKITKPQSAHFAYSIYFREPGGNHLEIEYYNPGGALHGRSHTAGHWENPLSEERFPGRGYLPQAFTHGTLQCDNVERSRQFYVDVLGWRSPRASTPPNTSSTLRRPGTSSSCSAARASISRR